MATEGSKRAFDVTVSRRERAESRQSLESLIATQRERIEEENGVRVRLVAATEGAGWYARVRFEEE